MYTYIHTHTHTNQCKNSTSFLSWLSETTESTVSERKERALHDASTSQRQLVSFLRLHLDAVKDSIDLVNRRYQFCQSKLDSMRTELAEALELGLNDLAVDLSANIAKFEVWLCVDICIYVSAWPGRSGILDSKLDV
jgi:hypothetical protein